MKLARKWYYKTRLKSQLIWWCAFFSIYIRYSKVCTNAHSILFIYTSSFWFICELLPLDECLHVSTWMAGGCVRVSFQYQTRSADKQQKIFNIFGNFIHAILSGIHVECVSTRILWAMRKRAAVLYFIPTVRVNQHSLPTHKHSKYSFCTQFCSVFITRWCFFYCLREWITFIHRYHPALSSSSLTFHIRELFISRNTVCLVDAQCTHSTYHEEKL